MVTYTRRTHVVRISDAAPGDPPSDTYVDVEVLDAISFIGPGGKEMVINMPAAEAVACIVDDTGGGNGKKPASPTRLSHMKRIVGDDPKQKLDVEVIDITAFQDANGEEWILDMHDTNGQPSVFNTTDNTGDNKATRRTHSEKLTGGTEQKDPKEFITVERCDAVAFRSILGKEMVIACPSNDDPNSKSSRASTYIWSPAGYDPANEKGPVPPPNSDSNVYVSFVDGADGFMTGKAKISQGPFWWIRKVSPGGAYVLVTIVAQNSANSLIAPEFPRITVDLGDKPLAKVIDFRETRRSIRVPPQTFPDKIYFVWNDIAPFPTVSDYNITVIGDIGSIADGLEYAQQFSRYVHVFGVGSTTSLIPNVTTVSPLLEPYSGTGFFPSFSDASDYATAYNASYASGGDKFGTYLSPLGFEVELPGGGPPLSVYPTFITLPVTISAFTASISTFTFLVRIPTAEAVEKFTPVVNTSDPGGISNIRVQGFSDQKKALRTIQDALDAEPDPDQPPQNGRQSMSTNPTNRTYTVTTEVVEGPNPSVKKHQVKIAITGGRDGGEG